MDFVILLIIAIVIAAVVTAAVAIESNKKKTPCTCPECRPDLYEPKTPEECDQRATLNRARARYLDSEIERKMKEAEHADVEKLLRDIRGKTNA